MIFVVEVALDFSDEWTKRPFCFRRSDAEFEVLWMLFCEGKSIIYPKEFTRARITVHGLS